VYDPAKHPNRVMSRSDHLLSVMLKGRMIDEAQYLHALMQLPFAEEPPPPADIHPGPGVGDEEEESPVGEAFAESARFPLIKGPEPAAVPIPGHPEREEDQEKNAPGYTGSDPSFAISFSRDTGPAKPGEMDPPPELRKLPE